ncbi:hypothetical protein VTN00DRAFT_1840 [Thermoascus crustaceus]|uniref:uncharacterized protein n=1 Tax=Thermoascus crustaceus TaxID=5088 RepID=UPI0037429907
MSFGFSVGDFITVIELANKIRKEFVEAPAQLKAISDEVRNLSFVVQDVEIDLSSKELSSQQKTELQEIAQSCRNVLTEIERTVDSYRELKTNHDMRRNTVKRVWKRLKWEPDDIHNLRNRISSNISLLNAFNGRITRSSVTNLVQHQDNQERQAILDWLSPVTYATQQSDNISRRQPGTGQWLLDSPEFQAWVVMPKQTLFCPGIPGAGKTILTSIVVEELYARYGNNSDIGIAYLYCNFQRHHEQRLKDLLASLLKQLAQGQPSLPDSVKMLYDQHRIKGTRPSIDEMSRALHLVSSHFSQLFIVIDALDECQISDGSRTRILDEIFSLQAKYSLNFFATSRFIPEITARFENKPSQEICASRQDVMRYLRGHLARLPSFVSRSPELQDEITVGIAEAADGMFLLAQLHLDSLMGKRSPRAIRSALKDLSTGSKTYDSVYNNAMERIEGQVPDQKELAKQVLSWITCAKRQLTTVELQNALAVELGDVEFDKDNLPDLVDMVSVCAGLVTVDEQSDIIRLVHYTTQEYFERTWTSWFPNAHREIASICVTYLSFNSFKAGFCSTDEEFEARLYQYPLYSYAAENWGDHGRAQLMNEELVINLLDDIPKLDACVQGLLARKRDSGDREYSQRVPRQVTGLHLAACFGLESVVQRLIQHGNQTDVKDSFGRTPLSWAALYGHEAMVQLLLEKGVDPDSKDKDAAAGGYLQSVRMLLAKSGINPDSKDNFGRTAQSDATRRGKYDIVKLLLQSQETGSAYPSDMSDITHPTACQGRIYCDICLINIPDVDFHYHCQICNHGDFDVCNECVLSGANCLDRNHKLVKRVIENGALVDVPE